MHADAEAWLERAGDQARWHALVPELSIGGAPAPELTLGEDELLAVQSDLFDEGWFHLGPRLERSLIERLAAGYARLRASSLPPVFAFVFDEPWQLSQQTAPLLRTVLGADFKLLPAIWAWHVDAGHGMSGWGPHRDRPIGTLSATGAPLALTLWVALTEATPWNGCIYVVPARDDRGYRSGDLGVAIPDPQAVRALPAEPGTIMGWTHRLIHWSGRSTERARAPRLSFSIEYQRGDIVPLDRPLLAPDAMPTFAARLALIGRMLTQYRNMVDLGEEVAAVGARLATRYAGALAE